MLEVHSDLPYFQTFCIDFITILDATLKGWYLLIYTAWGLGEKQGRQPSNDDRYGIIVDSSFTNDGFLFAVLIQPGIGG